MRLRIRRGGKPGQQGRSEAQARARGRDGPPSMEITAAPREDCMSTLQAESEARRALNPLFNDNKLKLGLFGVNVSNGCAITTVEGRHKVTWPTNLAIARTADRHGYEAMVPVARWRGFGGES